MDTDHPVTLRWHGAAHYQISHGGLRILIDPLFTRPPGDKPHLDIKRDDADRIDHILLTHAHLDHSLDVPYLAAKYDPEVYAPTQYLRDMEKQAERSGKESSSQKHHCLEEINGDTFSIADIEITPFQIGTEEIDFWFVRSLFLRPLIHGSLLGILGGIRWLTHHLFGNCFAFYFRLPPQGSTMLYFGNLTGQTSDLSEVESVDVLAIPYCPANRNWLAQSQCLIERFRPAVTLVHHFDNFSPPFTLSKYMNLEEYRKALQERCSGAKLYFSKFLREVDLAEIMSR